MPSGPAIAYAEPDTTPPPSKSDADPSTDYADSLHHRLWLCPHPSLVAAHARAGCPIDILTAALTADRDDPNCVFTTGRCTADPSLWPAPSSHFENVFQLADHDGTLRAVTLAEWEQRQRPHEVCYVDGACYPHVIPSLARAGWASVFFAQGKITASASAPVWHPAIQSSGVAEWTPLCGITQLLRQPTPVYTDYANLVSAAAAPRRAATIGALRHGGLQRFFEHHPNRRLVTDVFKVKAHVDIHTVANDESPPQARHRERSR